MFAAAFAILTVGAAIQGVAGFGANLLASPLLVLLDPALVPGPLIVAAIPLVVLTALANRGEHPWRKLRWANVGQLGGAALGAWVLATIPTDSIEVLFAVVILIAVALSASGLGVRRTPATMAAAGSLSAFTGTTVGIGGPPIALVHAGAPGEELRAALSRFFVVGTAISLVALSLAGRFTPADAGAGLLLVPGTVVGFAASRRLAARLDRHRLRIVVLVLSGVAAAVALVRAVA